MLKFTALFLAATLAVTSTSYFKGGKGKGKGHIEEPLPPSPSPEPPAMRVFTMDAGIDKAVVFPANSISLFGHMSGQSLNTAITWSQLSGPGTVTFTAEHSLATTATFPVAGTYVVQLSISDNGAAAVTDSATITVYAEDDTTNVQRYYVDPTYAQDGTGTAANPWNAFSGLSDSNAKWTSTINPQLATKHVIIYFSARIVASDTAETQSGSIEAWRSDHTDDSAIAGTNYHRLIFDGKSKYNTNDTANNGSWSDYTGTNKYKINMTAGSICIGMQGAGFAYFAYPTDYVTYRGFECTGNASANPRVILAGDETYGEHLYVHDVQSGGLGLFVYGAVNAQLDAGTVTTTSGSPAVVGSGTFFVDGCNPCGTDYDPANSLGPGGIIQIGGVTRIISSVTDNTHLTTTTNWAANTGVAYKACGLEFGNKTGITFRDNNVVDVQAEAIYVGGTYQAPDPGNCSIWGNTHQDILIENNTLTNAGSLGPQGDAIDLKAGLINVTIRGNTITSPTHDGIVCEGIFNASTTKALYVIENNTFISPGDAAIRTDRTNDVIIRNNIFRSASAESITAFDGNGIVSYDTRVYNNTFHLLKVVIGGTDGYTIRNNIFTGLSGGATVIDKQTNSTNVTSNYNVFQPDNLVWNGVTEGANSDQVASGTQIYTNVGSNDFTLVSTSIARDNGVSLSTEGVLFDIIKTLRPQNSTYDNGAYEFIVLTTRSKARVRKP